MKSAKYIKEKKYIFTTRSKFDDKTGFLGVFLIKLTTYFFFFIMLLILSKIFFEGGYLINFDFLTKAPINNMQEGGIGPAIFGTLIVTLLMILFASPIGIFSAIYINEYAENNFLKRVITISVNNLAGVPSIVFGLFGLGFFVLFIGRNIDEVMESGLVLGQPAILWASATLAILVLPTIIVTSVQALASVPESQRQASYGLGASKWETIHNVILPQAKPGILTGLILSLARGSGETAPILFLGSAFFLPDLPIKYIELGLFSIPVINPSEQFMALPYHIFILATQSSNPSQTLPIQFAASLVLLGIVVLLNSFAVYYRYKFRKILEEVSGV